MIFYQIMISVLFSIFVCVASACNSIITWNNVILDAIRHNASSPPVASRALAIVNVAMHDAVASILPNVVAHQYNAAK
jgi:hypothetical protein